MKLNKMIPAVLLVLCMFLALPSVSALAAEKIDTGRDVALTVCFKDGELPIAGAGVNIYKVADTDEYGDMTLTEQYSAYPVVLDELDQDKWAALAVTLQGYTQRDDLTPVAGGNLNESGELSLYLKPGLYLVLIEKQTAGDYTYTAKPYLVFLPGRDPQTMSWVYEVFSKPKYDKEPLPETITRKVLKIWNDEGYESNRPESVTVQLLKNGDVCDTQILNEENNWRFEWDKLDHEAEWLVVETEVDGYSTEVELEGITFTVTNSYIIPLPVENPPVAKKVTGDVPRTAGTFTFVLTAVTQNAPMPEESTGTKKEITITGTGSSSFGDITFSEPGTYIYTITEKNTGAKGYTYDDNVYTLSYVVTEKGKELSVSCTIADGKGNRVSTPVFTNEYHESELPYTGVLWWPVPMLFAAGLACCIVGMTRKRLSYRGTKSK